MLRKEGAANLQAKGLL